MVFHYSYIFFNVEIIFAFIIVYIDLDVKKWFVYNCHLTKLINQKP